jgi:hypothetical protein
MVNLYCKEHGLLKSIFSPGTENENKTSQHILDRWSLSHYLFGQMLKINFNKLTTKQIIAIQLLWEMMEIVFPTYLDPNINYKGDSLINIISDTFLTYLGIFNIRKEKYKSWSKIKRFTYFATWILSCGRNWL